MLGAPAVFCDCCLNDKKVLGFGFWAKGSEYISISSSFMVLAGKIPKIPLAVNHYSETIFDNIFCASLNKSDACSPTTSSVNIAGYFPYNSQD